MLLLFALTLAVGAYHLGAKSLWNDELVSVGVARRDLAGLLHVVSTGEAQMALYYLLLHWWIALVGQSEAAVRALSVLAGAGAIVLAYALARRLLGSRPAFVCAGLLALHAFFVLNAQEARAYTLLLLLTTASSLLFLRALELPTALRWAVYALVSTLALYAHLFAIWTIAAHACVLALGVSRPTPRMRGFVTFTAILALSLPLLRWMAVAQPDAYAWIGPPDWNAAQTFARDFGAFGGAPFGLLLIGLAAAFVLRGRPTPPSGSPRLQWTKTFLVVWVTVVVAGPLAASFLVRPMFVSRYVISALLPFLLLATGGLAMIRPAWLRAAVLIVMLGVLGRSLHFFVYRASPRENWRDGIALLLEHAKPGDGVVFRRSHNRLAFDFYGPGADARHGLEPVFPDTPWNGVSLVSGQQADAGDWLQNHTVVQLRVWTIERWYESASTGELRWLPPSFRRRYCESQRHHVLRVRIVLHQRCEPLERGHSGPLNR